MKKFILISPKNRPAYNFRGDLIKDIIAKGYEVIVTGPNQEGVDRITALGARFVEVPMNKNGVNPLADLSYMNRLRRLMKEEGVDASLGYTIKPVIYGSIAAWLTGVKKRSAMITGAGYLFSSNTFKAKLIRFISFWLYRIGLACAHSVIFQNADDLNDFVKHHLVKASKCSVVNGSGVNMKRFPLAPYPEKPSFFFLGRLIHSKGGLDFAQAASIVKEDYPNTRFFMLGKIDPTLDDAILKDEIEPYIKEGTIELFPESDDIVPYYAQASVFVLPTAYREGTPRVILEAMSSGRAIITTNSPGCKETVVDGENGYFVPAHEPEILAEKIKLFIKFPEIIRSMGEKSYQLCQTKYEVSIINKKMIDLMGI